MVPQQAPLRIAYEALALVEQGLSERGAVNSVVSTDRSFGGHRQKALELVIGALSIRDLLDRILHEAFQESPSTVETRCLGRLVTYLFLSTNSMEPGHIRAFRDVAPPGARAKLEYLIGFLPSVDTAKFYDGLSELEALAIRTHHPQWWVEYCCRLIGRNEAIELLSSPPRPRYLRVNSLRNRGRTTPPHEAKALANSLKPSLSAKGIYVMSQDLSPLAPFFEQGLFQFQDLASYSAVIGGEPSPGEMVLDLCASPGAKTAAIAQLMKNKGTIISVDYSRNRMRTWEREIMRLGVKIASPVVADASRLGLRGEFDLVLLDPPCSGTGILDRNPRMKWHLDAKVVARYSQLQSRMIEEAARLSGPNGRILYCTCTLTLEENEGVVSEFLYKHPEFETRPVLKTKGSPGLRGLTDCRRFYPHRDKTAGYFIARLEHVA